MTFPREGKFTSSHFFASRDVMGCVGLPLDGPPPAWRPLPSFPPTSLALYAMLREGASRGGGERRVLQPALGTRPLRHRIANRTIPRVAGPGIPRNSAARSAKRS